ncbi:MAG: MoaD/ThiS family protein [Thermoplasmata archaeon]
MSIEIEVELAANLKQTLNKRVFTYKLEEGATVENLLDSLNYSELEKKYILVSKNGKMAKLSEELKDKDKLFLSVLVGGG